MAKMPRFFAVPLARCANTSGWGFGRGLTNWRETPSQNPGHAPASRGYSRLLGEASLMVMLKRAMLLLVAALLATASCTSIDDHGGVPNDASNAAAAANTKALEDTLQQANGSDKMALVPAGKSYYVFNVESSGLRGVRLQIDGALLASDNMSAWPNGSSNNTYTYAALSLYDCHDLTLTGNGVFDGQGYVWWWEVILFHVDNRPHLVAMDECTNVTIENLKFVNSPQFHLRLSGMKGLHVSLCFILCVSNTCLHHFHMFRFAT